MQRTGRPQLMHPPAQLGLYLFFIGRTMGNKHLCLFFGITSEIINEMLLLVVCKLKRHPLAEVMFPDAEKMESFARQINECEPILSMMLSVSWIVSHFNLSAHPSLLSRIPCIVVTIVTLW
jgi:hypothetical protein